MQEAVQAGLLCWLYYVCRRDYHDLWSKARFFFSVLPCFTTKISAVSSPNFEPTGKPCCFHNAALVVSDSGTKAAPLFLIEMKQLHLPS
jgi:hypothetical protein